MTIEEDSLKYRRQLADILNDSLRFSGKINPKQQVVVVELLESLVNRPTQFNGTINHQNFLTNFTLAQVEVIVAILNRLGEVHNDPNHFFITLTEVEHFDHQLRDLGLDSIPGVEPEPDEDLRSFLKQLS